MKHIILTLALSLIIFCVHAQVCYTYDNAGNRIKRQTCLVALTQKDNDLLKHSLSELPIEHRSINYLSDFSNLVIYPNPTCIDFQLMNQSEWLGAKLSIYNLIGTQINILTISHAPIDVSHLSSGTYILTLSKDSIIKSSKLTITK